MKKITKATFKSFVNKNRDNLYIKVKSSFDGMVDSVVYNDSGYQRAVAATYVHDNNLGVKGIWLVNGSRDMFRYVEENGFSGIEVYNCCGTFIVAVKQ